MSVSGYRFLDSLRKVKFLVIESIAKLIRLTADWFSDWLKYRNVNFKFIDNNTYISIYIPTYIIDHYNSSVRITA